MSLAIPDFTRSTTGILGPTTPSILTHKRHGGHQDYILARTVRQRRRRKTNREMALGTEAEKNPQHKNFWMNRYLRAEDISSACISKLDASMDQVLRDYRPLKLTLHQWKIIYCLLFDGASIVTEIGSPQIYNFVRNTWSYSSSEEDRIYKLNEDRKSGVFFERPTHLACFLFMVSASIADYELFTNEFIESKVKEADQTGQLGDLLLWADVKRSKDLQQYVSSEEIVVIRFQNDYETAHCYGEKTREDDDDDFFDSEPWKPNYYNGYEEGGRKIATHAVLYVTPYKIITGVNTWLRSTVYDFFDGNVVGGEYIEEGRDWYEADQQTHEIGGPTWFRLLRGDYNVGSSDAFKRAVWDVQHYVFLAKISRPSLSETVSSTLA